MWTHCEFQAEIGPRTHSQHRYLQSNDEIGKVLRKVAAWTGYQNEEYHRHLKSLVEEDLKKIHFKVTNIESFLLTFTMQEDRSMFKSFDRCLRESIKVINYFEKYHIENNNDENLRELNLHEWKQLDDKNK